MTVRTPIVLVGREHVPLAEGDTLNVPVPLSGSEDNLLSNTANGLMAELHVDPTGSIQLTGKGTSAKPLSGALKLDPVAGNLLSDSTAGVKVVLTYAESETVAMRGKGVSGDELRADVRVSSNADNLLSSVGDGLFAAKEELSPDDGNTLERRENGLFAAGGGGLSSVQHNASLTGDGTAESPLKFSIVGSSGSTDSNNILKVDSVQDGQHSLRVPHVAQVMKETASITATVGDDGTGARASILDVRLSGRTGNALQVMDFGEDGGAGLFVSSDITLSAQKSNILTKASDGYFVDGTHRIIPKFYATTVYPLLGADQVTTYPDGTIRSEVTWSGINPPAVGGVSAYTMSQVQSKVRLMDASGNPIKVQLEIVRVSGANWKLVALLSGKPASAYNIDNNAAYPGDGNELVNFPVGITTLYGYNPTQLGLA